MEHKYRKKTDNQIVCTINKNNAMTESELSKALGYQSLASRLRTMAKKGKVQYIIVANNTSCKYKLFRDYAGVKLYYIDMEHLYKWVKKHLPKMISEQQQQAITMRIRRDFRLEDT
jgi:hypothetical protein